MKLKYRYEVDAWGEDESKSLKSISRRVGNCDVEFLFDDAHRLVAINVLVPNVKVTFNAEGTVQPLDKNKDGEAHNIANYIVNVIQEQTGKCDIRKMPDTPEYVPETLEEKRELEGKILTRTKSLTASASISGRFDFTEEALNKYLKQSDAFAIYSDARRMNNPVGKYREFFRVFECFFRSEKATSGKTEFDLKKFSEYFTKHDGRYKEEDIKSIVRLRNRCSHAVRDYVTSNDLVGMEQVKTKIETIQKMVKSLIDNPP